MQSIRDLGAALNLSQKVVKRAKKMMNMELRNGKYFIGRVSMEATVGGCIFVACWYGAAVFLILKQLYKFSLHLQSRRTAKNNG